MCGALTSITSYSFDASHGHSSLIKLKHSSKLISVVPMAFV
jgi:hypothetical protein